jgi:glycosyltransferase involved in cell wall biosynthesis
MLCYKIYHHTLAVSVAVRNKFPSHSQKITVLYNGLDTLIFKFDEKKREAFRSQKKLGSNEISIGILGSIVEHKGHIVLLNALKKLLFKNYIFKLFIVGKFAPHDQLYIQAVENMIGEFPDHMVELIGYTDNIAQIYSGLDIVANSTLPSIGEPLGTTIYEGMSFERIVVASDTGGTPEIIDNGINGFLFEAGNSDDLAQKLAHAIDSYKACGQMRLNARTKVENVFNINLMVYNYNKILASL